MVPLSGMGRAAAVRQPGLCWRTRALSPTPVWKLAREHPPGKMLRFAGKKRREISHSYVKADTVSAHGNAAGFVSENTKEISKSYAAGEVQGSKESGKAAAGFVLTNTGKVSHSFSVCQVKAQAGSSGGEASGFVWKMTGGSISYSYSASSLVKNGAVRYAFERTEGQGAYCRLLLSGLGGDHRGHSLRKCLTA